MKKIILGIILILFFICLFSPGIAARAEESVQEELENEVEKGLDDLITSDIENFFNSLKDSTNLNLGGSFKELVKRIIKGESIDINLFFDAIWDAVKNNIFSVIGSLVTIVMLAILYGLSKNLSSGFIKESTNQIIYYAVYGSIIATLCIIINSAIMSAKTLISSVTGLVEIAFPILLTLMAALGGSASSAVFQPVTLIFTNVVVKVIDTAVMPMFYATMVFTIIGNLTQNIRLDKMTSAIQSIAKWCLSIMFGVIIALVTVQGIVGASVDTISVKSAKFALSSYVPILGGYLSEGFDIVMASAILLKNAVGLAAVIILFLIILAPVIKIVVLTLLMKVTAGVVEPMSDNRISGLLYLTSKNLSILISVVLGLSFLVFIILMLIIYTFNLGAV